MITQIWKHKDVQTPSALDIYYLFKKIILSHDWRSQMHSSQIHGYMLIWGHMAESPWCKLFILFFPIYWQRKSSVIHFCPLFGPLQCIFTTLNPLGSHGNMPTPAHDVLSGSLIDCSLTLKTINRIWDWGSLGDKAEQKHERGATSFSLSRGAIAAGGESMLSGTGEL